MLRKTRVIVSILTFGLLTWFMLDSRMSFILMEALAKHQVIPAILAINVSVLVFLFLLTFIFGRVYCSVLCPMGIFQDIINWLSKRGIKGQKKTFGYSKPKNILRYSILGVVILAFWANISVVIAVLDPYSAYGKIVTYLFKPIFDGLGNMIAWAIDGLGIHLIYHEEIVMQSIVGLSIASFIFILIFVMAWWYGRTYCNTICPVGSLLGIISRYSLFKIRVDESKCSSCGLCSRKCKASCINSAAKSIDYSRCVGCFDCIESCKKKAIHFTWRKAIVKDEVTPQIDTSRRQFLATTVLTATLAPQLMAQDKLEEATSFAENGPRRKQRNPIIPAGAISMERFTKRCTSCHLCINKCPSRVLRPSLNQYGWAGVMQPTMIYAVGACNFDCTVCGDVCPVGAILPLTVEQKQKVKIGIAQFNINHCLVKLKGEVCGNCARHCPVNAITMQQRGEWVIPVVDTDACIGCGACEYHCPGIPHPAIRVSGLERHEMKN